MAVHYISLYYFSSAVWHYLSWDEEVGRISTVLHQVARFFTFQTQLQNKAIHTTSSHQGGPHAKAVWEHPKADAQDGAV